MSNSRSYNNVSRERLARMKARMLAEVRKISGYSIEKYDFPDGDNVRWHLSLKGDGNKKKVLNFAAHLIRNANQLTVKIIKIPSFVSHSRAFQEIDRIYRDS